MLPLHEPAVPGALLQSVEIADAAAPDTISDSDRYSRQVLFPGIGQEGQNRLQNAHAAVVGCGATGAAAASMLARAGVGRLTIIDRDFVEASNLQRQILFDEEDAQAGTPKAEAARRHIAQFNSRIGVHAHVADLVPENAGQLLGGAQIILDATDNFETRYLINDYAVREGVPWIYAAAIGAYAATMNILPRNESSEQPWGVAPTACLACIFPKPPAGTVETCDTAGILASAVNFAASLQVTEALKFLAGHPERMRRTLLSFELWDTEANGALGNSQIAAGKPREGCEVCGQRKFAHLSGESRPHITLCGRDSVQIHEHHRPVDFAELGARLRQHREIQSVRSNELLLRFRRGPYTVTVFGDGRAVVQGTTDPMVARTLYARFVGS